MLGCNLGKSRLCKGNKRAGYQLCKSKGIKVFSSGLKLSMDGKQVESVVFDPYYLQCESVRV